MRVAESILFAGKAIRVLRNPSPSFRFQDAVYHHQMPRSSQKIQGLTGRVPFQKEPLMDTKLIGEELLPQSEADKIEAMLLDLKVVCTTVHCNILIVCNPSFDGYSYLDIHYVQESSEFHKRSFESAVDSIRVIAASHLWQV